MFDDAPNVERQLKRMEGALTWYAGRADRIGGGQVMVRCRHTS